MEDTASDADALVREQNNQEKRRASEAIDMFFPMAYSLANSIELEQIANSADACVTINLSIRMNGFVSDSQCMITKNKNNNHLFVREEPDVYVINISCISLEREQINKYMRLWCSNIFSRENRSYWKTNISEETLILSDSVYTVSDENLIFFTCIHWCFFSFLIGNLKNRKNLLIWFS